MVRDVEVSSGAVVVTVELDGPHRCPCGELVGARYDATRRRWRHLDVAGGVLWVEAMLARLSCPRCGRVRTEEVTWARPGSHYTRDFEQQVAWLGQRMDLSSLARLMRCGWDSVHRIVTRVVADHLVESRFEGLRRIGVDEVSYKKGHSYLTVVVDHDRRRVVWVGIGKSQETLQEFYDQIGPDRCRLLESVSMDGGPAYRAATEANAPQARIGLDPFHVMKWANQALEASFRDSRVAALKAELKEVIGPHGSPNRGWSIARHAVRAGKEKLTGTHHQVLDLLRRERAELYQAWQFKEELRDLFSSVDPQVARGYLEDWLTRARLCTSRPFATFALRLAKYTELIVAGIEERISNGRLEGTNTRIKVIQRRGYGIPNPHSLIAMIYLNCGRFEIALPTRS